MTHGKDTSQGNVDVSEGNWDVASPPLITVCLLPVEVISRCTCIVYREKCVVIFLNG